MKVTRRELLEAGGAAGLAFAGLKVAAAGAFNAVPTPDALAPDPGRLLDLAPGFSYAVISRAGEPMADGLRVPGAPDGMAAFAAEGGRVLLVRNHELSWHLDALSAIGPHGKSAARLTRERCFDVGPAGPSLGGTTSLIYNPRSKAVERCWMSLAGTELNCAGGPTPWGSWLTCEEATDVPRESLGQDHGWVFEVPGNDRSIADPIPLREMGRFMHEAAAVDPRTGIVYLTEDRFDAAFYRFLPSKPGMLRAGGTLQALAVVNWPQADTRNWSGRSERFEVGREFEVHWLSLDEVDAPADDLRLRAQRHGAAIFARGEGLAWARDEAYMTCTAGGQEQHGQLLRYRPSPFEGTSRERESPGKLSLFIEAGRNSPVQFCDNIVCSPRGELFVCQDLEEHANLVRVTASGKLHPFARARCHGEVAGPCFAPDGRTLFLNLQWCGITLAITGPFEHLRA